MNKHYCIFADNLYIGESVDNPALVRWKLTHGAGQFGIYLITPALNGIDQLEIIHCANLKQKYYREHPALIYGIAAGKAEAMDLLVTISDEASASGMDGDLLGYLRSSGGKGE